MRVESSSDSRNFRLFAGGLDGRAAEKIQNHHLEQTANFGERVEAIHDTNAISHGDELRAAALVNFNGAFDGFRVELVEAWTEDRAHFDVVVGGELAVGETNGIDFDVALLDVHFQRIHHQIVDLDVRLFALHANVWKFLKKILIKKRKKNLFKKKIF